MNYIVLPKGTLLTSQCLPKWDCIHFKSGSGFSVSCYGREKLAPWQIARFSLGNAFQRVGLKPQVRATITLNLCKKFCKRFRFEREIAILRGTFLFDSHGSSLVSSRRVPIRTLGKITWNNINFVEIWCVQPIRTGRPGKLAICRDFVPEVVFL